MRGFSVKHLNNLQVANESISTVLNDLRLKNKSVGTIRSVAILVDVQKKIDELLKNKRARIYSGNEVVALLPEEVQKRRDEVLEMVRNESPLPSIKKFRGKDIDGDPIKFFRENYFRYISKNLEVIYSVDLLKIDSRLLSSLRNTVSSENMPLGNSSDRTDAIYEGRFSDGVESKTAAEAARVTRAQRSKKRHTEVA